jgi:cytochrome P450
MSEIYYDPYDYEIDADPHPVWRRMRDERPVYYNERFDFYALSRYEDVHAALKDWETFSSARGTLLEMIRSPEAIEASRNLLFSDPPEHDQLRSLVGRRFTPKRVAEMDPHVREICRGYLDRYVGSQGFDFVQDFGALIPMMVICSFIGIPGEDRDAIRMLADASLHREEGDTGFSMEASMTMARYFDGALALRSFLARDDFITELLTAEVTLEDGSKRALDHGEAIRFLLLAAGGGNETVARLMSWAGALLAEHPEQRQTLVDNPELIPNAIEEILRYECPSPVQARYVTRDVTFHGVTIPEGSVALLLNNSANRDERQFVDPDRFDVTRDAKSHLAFGFGVHFCVGASLARLESRIALEETLQRFPQWDVDWEKAERTHTSTVRGYHRLPITIPS